MVREGYPFILLPVLIAAVLFFFGFYIVGAGFIALALFMAYFFRDPKRVHPLGSDLVLSAADGRVTRIDKSDDSITVSVFLSPLDVHINRSPITGTIRTIDYTRGKKMPATSDNASFVNERNSLVIDGEYGSVRVTQIAGIVARRIVCWPKAGDHLDAGEKFGLIKFSSRTDLELPPGSELLVSVGDRVIGGETVIAHLK